MQVLEEILKASEMSSNLSQDTQRLPHSLQNILAGGGAEQQGHILDQVMVENPESLTWTDTGQQKSPTKTCQFVD